MSKPAPIHADSSRPSSPASALLSASGCLTVSSIALTVHGVSTTRATTRDLLLGRASRLARTPIRRGCAVSLVRPMADGHAFSRADRLGASLQALSVRKPPNADQPFLCRATGPVACMAELRLRVGRPRSVHTCAATRWHPNCRVPGFAAVRLAARLVRWFHQPVARTGRLAR